MIVALARKLVIALWRLIPVRRRQLCSLAQQRDFRANKHDAVSAVRNHIDAELQTTDRGGGNPTLHMVIEPAARKTGLQHVLQATRGQNQYPCGIASHARLVIIQHR
jgi:hypothetical protein